MSTSPRTAFGTGTAKKRKSAEEEFAEALADLAEKGASQMSNEEFRKSMELRKQFIASLRAKTSPPEKK